MPFRPRGRSPRSPQTTRPWTARGRRAAVAVVVALVAPLAMVGLTGPAHAAPVRAFTPAFSVNTNGDILLAANTLMTCGTTTGDTGAATCATARAAITGTYSNNNYTARFVDVDADATTFNSSSARLDVPAGGTVLFAALVWGGRTTGTSGVSNNSALRQTARLTVPGATAAATVTATQVDVGVAEGVGTAYQSYLDVTGLVAAAGSGDYTLANVQSASGAVNQYAGWSLVVAVSDPSAPARNLTVFTGLASVATSDPLPTFTVSGFLTPPSGPVRTTMGAVTYEGDMGLTGDTFRLNGTTVSDALNPGTNPFNSTVSNRGAQVATRDPAHPNQLGYDADLFSANGVLPNSATSATISLTTAGDQYFPGVVTFATDLYDPKLLGTKTVVDDNGGAVNPLDVLTYTVPVENIGLDVSTRSRFFDAIPTGTTFVPGSITVDGVVRTDGAGDDLAEYVQPGLLGQGHVLAYLGSGATPSVGGAIPITSGSSQHVVTFQVRVDADATNGQQIINAATLGYRGQTTDASSSSATNAVLEPVVTAPIAGNAPPTATPHILSFTPAPGARTLSVPVLAGDTDPEGGTLTVVGVTDASGGSLTIDQDGTVTYAPRDDVAGRDVFTYTIQDPAGNRATATVQIEVINTAPEAVDDAVTVPSSSTTAVALVGNDTDANGDSLSVRSAGPASSAGGTVVVSNGVVSYTPPAGLRGTDTFTYVVQDTRGGSDTATVTVTVVNSAPVARDDSYVTDTGTAVSLTVRANDSDPDGDPLTATRLTGPSNGTLTLDAAGTGTYTPAAGWSGTDTVTYRVSDGFGGTADATVTITVNGAPIAADDTATAAPDAAVDVTVLGNDTDPDGDTLTVAITSAPTHGSVVVRADGTVTYTPAAGWAGVDTFTYRAVDGRGLQDTATVTVTTANAAPVANPDAAGTATNTPVSGVDVLGNDTDSNVAAGVPGQTLTVGSASADNGATVVVAADGTLTVTPATGFSGTVTVTYTVTDGAGGTDGTDEGTLTVTVANGGPTAAPDGPVTTPTGTSVLVDVLRNDTDLNPADALTIVPGSLSTPQDGDGTPRGSVAAEAGQVRYMPPAGWAGTVTFTYETSDGQGGTSTGTVTVVVANAAPVAGGDAVSTPAGTPVTVDVLLDDSDANIPGTDQVLTVVGAVGDNGATVVVGADGRLTVTPAPGFKGLVTVTYTVGDGAGGTDQGELVVSVANAAPVAVADSVTTPFGTPVDVRALTNDLEPNDGDTLTVVPGSLTAPVDATGVTRGTVTLADGVVTYTPPAGFSGVVTFRYTATDGLGTSVATVTITVANAPPVAADNTATTTSGTAVTIDVLRNDSDPDGGTLSVVSVSQPASGSVAVVDGRLVYTPAPGFAGTVTFTYTVSDGNGGTATATVTIVVGAATPAPGAPAGTGSQAAASSRSGLAVTGVEVVRTLALITLLVGSGTALLWARRRLTV